MRIFGSAPGGPLRVMLFGLEPLLAKGGWIRSDATVPRFAVLAGSRCTVAREPIVERPLGEQDEGFEGGYWSAVELKATFSELLGATKPSLHRFLGLRLAAAEGNLTRRALRPLVWLSEFMRGRWRSFPPGRLSADRVCLKSIKP